MFYFLRQNFFAPEGMMGIQGHTPETGALSWIAGEKFASPLSLQTLRLDLVAGNNFPDFFDSTVPVMSERLVSFLIEQGVDNMDTYPVLLHNPVSGEVVSGYFAINVVGCIDAVKLENSQYRLRFGKPYFTGRMVLDDSRVYGASFFRLLYGPGFIVVSQAIADALGRETWAGILLQPTEHYAGA